MLSLPCLVFNTVNVDVSCLPTHTCLDAYSCHAVQAPSTFLNALQTTIPSDALTRSEWDVPTVQPPLHSTNTHRSALPTVRLPTEIQSDALIRSEWDVLAARPPLARFHPSNRRRFLPSHTLTPALRHTYTLAPALQRTCSHLHCNAHPFSRLHCTADTHTHLDCTAQACFKLECTQKQVHVPPLICV